VATAKPSSMCKVVLFVFSKSYYFTPEVEDDMLEALNKCFKEVLCAKTRSTIAARVDFAHIIYVTIGVGSSQDDSPVFAAFVHKAVQSW